jgi:hypothetical protein
MEWQSIPWSITAGGWIFRNSNASRYIPVPGADQAAVKKIERCKTCMSTSACVLDACCTFKQKLQHVLFQTDACTLTHCVLSTFGSL